jgi:hypothetical protein
VTEKACKAFTAAVTKMRRADALEWTRIGDRIVHAARAIEEGAHKHSPEVLRLVSEAADIEYALRGDCVAVTAFIEGVGIEDDELAKFRGDKDEDSLSSDIAETFAKDCRCCPSCGPVPCDGLLAGGLRDQVCRCSERREVDPNDLEDEP